MTDEPTCGRSRIRAPLAPPRMSEPKNVDAEPQNVVIISGTISTDAPMASPRLEISSEDSTDLVAGKSDIAR